MVLIMMVALVAVVLYLSDGNTRRDMKHMSLFSMNDKGDSNKYAVIPDVKEFGDRQKQLDTQYITQKEELARYFLQFQMTGDTVGMLSIQAELEELNKQYDTALAEIEGGVTMEFKVKKRCTRCLELLNEKGKCTNPKCPKYTKNNISSKCKE